MRECLFSVLQIGRMSKPDPILPGHTALYAEDHFFVNSIDPAILRRMPKRFAIRLPNHAQRLKILHLMLSHASLSPGFDFEELARRTDGLSGSDLKETCRNAAMIPVRELMREKGGKGIKGMEEAKREVGRLEVRVRMNVFNPLTDMVSIDRVSCSGHSRCQTLWHTTRMRTVMSIHQVAHGGIRCQEETTTPCTSH